MAPLILGGEFLFIIWLCFVFVSLFKRDISCTQQAEEFLHCLGGTGYNEKKRKENRGKENEKS